MLLHRLVGSTSARVVGSVTQSSALTGSATASQSFTSRPPSAPSPGTCPWYLDYGASFHMTSHSAYLSSMCPSYRHLTLFAARQGTLCSDSFYVPDISLVPDLTMQLILLGRLLTMIVVSFLTLIFVIFRIVALHPSVLRAMSSLLCPRHHFLSDIIIWVIFVVLDYLRCFIEVF
jgi:hypothetical protein